MKQIVIISLLCYFSFSKVYSQTKNDFPKDFLRKLKAYHSKYITEKTYLHFDKPYYASGDTIYFKAYVILGEKHELSNLSGVLHVDLINPTNQIYKQIKLQIINGLAPGDFALPDSLPKGYYHIRAYTQWMRNTSDDAFFEQTIPVGSILDKDRISENATFVKTTNEAPDIQFFPEGGSLVTGINSKIAFKVVGPNGLGVAVKGIVFDNLDKEVATFTAARLGMGSFYLKPEAKKTYKVNLIYAGGLKYVRELPTATDQGIVLKVNNDSLDKADVKIIANENYFAANSNKDFYLVVYSDGLLNQVPLKLDSTTISLAVLKGHLHTGITRLTLFSGNGEPLSERLIFIQNPDQLKLNVVSDKNIYKTREKVHLKLNVLSRADSAAIGHFSIAIIDESKVSVNENEESTILTNLLLTSELKGLIEQPAYYFNNPNLQTRSDLDLVMLTHGYRSFEWKKLLNNEYPSVAYQPEKGLEISGTAITLLGKPLVNGTVSLIAQSGGLLLAQTTDKKGQFHFNNLMFSDSARFVLNATNKNGKNNTKLIYRKDEYPLASNPDNFHMNVSQPSLNYIENSRNRHDDAVVYGNAKRFMLEEVKIRQSKKRILDESYHSSSLSGPGNADQVMSRKELNQVGGSLITRLNGRLRGITFIGNKPALTGYGDGNPMLVVVDGFYPSLLDMVNPNDIETVEVLKFNNAAIYGMAGGHGVLVITTRQGGQDLSETQSVGILPIKVTGFYKGRNFYSPKYDHQPDSFLKRTDFRSTIYWNPEVTTDQNGNASIDFFNADGAGTCRVVVEGIDEQGNLGRKVYRYQVNN